ncbi:HalOD1 output domain-containing protein [Halobaculum halobium]|uniref:HalOD1 output domain-containing protein n=1 Tax=Halobaculum halobium TaxID=3032281 RepID=A0ABD5T9Z2_9EURY|nr:HalOD1 output domain-containing protein [Halobaculum sp. SYNS20]
MTQPSVLEDTESGIHDTIDAPRDGGAVSGVVRAVAAVDGVDPVDLDATIEEAIDADALESLARHDATDWRLEFPLGDHAIVVEGDGTVLVDASVFPNRF